MSGIQSAEQFAAADMLRAVASLRRRTHVLFYSQDEAEQERVKQLLGQEFRIATCSSVAQLQRLLDKYPERITVLVVSQQQPIEVVVAALKYACQEHPRICRLVLADEASPAIMLAAINQFSVFHYLLHPWRGTSLRGTLILALEHYAQAIGPVLLNAREQASGEREGEVLQALLGELRDECDSWRDYAARSFGDVGVYRQGIEILASKYCSRIKSRFELAQARQLTRQVDDFLARYYLSEPALASIIVQQANVYSGLAIK